MDKCEDGAGSSTCTGDGESCTTDWSCYIGSKCRCKATIMILGFVVV